MKVKNLICKINPRSFISDYLIALGVPENEVEDEEYAANEYEAVDQETGTEDNV